LEGEGPGDPSLDTLCLTIRIQLWNLYSQETAYPKSL
jgi:hypothetical protein